MRKLIDLRNLRKEGIFEIFYIADEIQKERFKNLLNGKSIVLFFPNTSLRTRITFEKGIYLLGGQSMLFPAETYTIAEKGNIRDYKAKGRDHSPLINKAILHYIGISSIFFL